MASFLLEFSVVLMSVWVTITAVSVQSPPVWDSLAILQGKRPLSNTDIQEMFVSFNPGVDFPNYSYIPMTSFKCDQMRQPGYYADVDTRCQVIRRCDTGGNQWGFLCPNMTVFNQITLTCDWWYNVDCSQSIHFYDYSNSRLYQGQDIRLLDDQDIIEVSQMVDDSSSYGQKPSRKPSYGGDDDSAATHYGARKSPSSKTSHMTEDDSGIQYAPTKSTSAKMNQGVEGDDSGAQSVQRPLSKISRAGFEETESHYAQKPSAEKKRKNGGVKRRRTASSSSY